MNDESQPQAGPRPEFVKVGTVDEVPEGEMKGWEVNGVQVGVANVEGVHYAFHDCCTHQQYRLTDSFLLGERLTCDWHGASFDIRTGEVKALPATRDLPMFPVEVRDGELWVAVPHPDEIEMPPE